MRQIIWKKLSICQTRHNTQNQNELYEDID